MATTWKLSSFISTTDVKELIPEFFFLQEFLQNSERMFYYIILLLPRTLQVSYFCPAYCENICKCTILGNSFFCWNPLSLRPFLQNFIYPPCLLNSWLLSIFCACGLCLSKKRLDPARIYLLKVNNTRTRFEICSELTIKTMTSFYVFIVYFEHISHLVLMFLLLTLNM